MSTQFKDHFSKQAALYAEARPHYPEELFEWVASKCEMHDTVWDCATGNGQAATSLVHYFHEVIATDASAAQIQNATPHARIDFRVATAENSGLHNESVDAVTAATALHWFNFEAFYTEAKRVLKPGGLLACWSYGWQHISEDIDKIVMKYGLEFLRGYWPPERDHIDTLYKHIPFPTPEIQAPEFFCRETWTMHQYVAYINSWSGTQKYVDMHGENPFAKFFLKDLEKAWGHPDEKRLIIWPVVMKAWKKAPSLP